MRINDNILRVLAVLAADPAEGSFGNELAKALNKPTGSIYPMLTRLLDAGLVTAKWEKIDPSEAGRPKRKMYLITASGQETLSNEKAKRLEWDKKYGLT